MTNFFGSVMKTIHTDSAYRSQSNKIFGGAKVKISLDQSTSDNGRRILTKSDDEDQFNKLSRKVN